MACSPSDICNNCACFVHDRNEFCGCVFCYQHSAFRKVFEVFFLSQNKSLTIAYALTGYNTFVDKDIVALQARRNLQPLFLDRQYPQRPCLQYVYAAMRVNSPFNVLRAFIVIFYGNCIFCKGSNLLVSKTWFPFHIVRQKDLFQFAVRFTYQHGFLYRYFLLNYCKGGFRNGGDISLSKRMP